MAYHADAIKTVLGKLSPTALLLIVAVLALGQVLSARYLNPLRKIPGPWLASVTKLWKVHKTLQERMERENIRLHQKYGPIVRIAPNEVSIDDPEESLRIIYGPGSQYRKARWYEASDPPGAHSLFTDSDIQRHAHDRRMVSAAFSMTAVTEMEDFISDCVTMFETRLGEFADKKEPIDMAHWLQCYAFDVIGEITFARRFGFLDKGEDVGDIMKTLDGFLSYSAKMGTIPELHRPYTTVMSWLFPRSDPFRSLKEFSRVSVESRVKEGAQHPDFLSRFMQAHNQKPNDFPMSEVYKMCMVLVGAGSDTTAIALRAVVYFLCKNPEKLAKLRSEIDEADRTGTLSAVIKYKEALKLPYLQAVLKEAMRLHPSTGFTLARVVPKGGTVLLGYDLPEGTTVGINSWVAHRNENVFGNDVESFIPERWLVSEESVRKLDRYFLEFGLGARTCLGKNISLMEMSKVIPQIFRAFDIELVNLQKVWKTTNWWLVKQADMDGYVKRRVKN
ncbi:hypothetical protein LTR20_006117 [Exophiala xenobiotica]|nr:hypothetical protein LTS13_002915 [Exophiala xenobiotica]KAK5395910.1 hypothetical protein LTR79_006664 [Exophiala xenobiotica]KAK5423864.1 hypothetical protein LTR90_001210 [Exophiala xenobiotica]KAK5462168.1 hypothetical protein LTR20_006117 [Exophiala xenobiotica]KAK5479666.1 hypothetical protein LTR26_007519 [Exophiala xenobiotica]